MSEREGFSGGQILWAFLGGVAAGAVVAYLTSPSSGVENRARLREIVASGRERVVRVPEAVRDAGRAAKEAFSEGVAKSH